MTVGEGKGKGETEREREKRAEGQGRCEASNSLSSVFVCHYLNVCHGLSPAA